MHVPTRTSASVRVAAGDRRGGEALAVAPAVGRRGSPRDRREDERARPVAAERDQRRPRARGRARSIASARQLAGWSRSGRTVRKTVFASRTRAATMSAGLAESRVVGRSARPTPTAHQRRNVRAVRGAAERRSPTRGSSRGARAGCGRAPRPPGTRRRAGRGAATRCRRFGLDRATRVGIWANVRGPRVAA